MEVALVKENTVFSKSKPSKTLKKTKKPLNKVSSFGARKKVAHALLRDIVILRDKECVCPPPEKGHSSVMQAGHMIRGTKGGTYFDLWNVHLQCKSCNRRHVDNEQYYVDWFLREFGVDQKLRLGKDSEKMGLKSYEMEEIILQLQAIKGKQMLAIELGKEFKPYFTQQVHGGRNDTHCSRHNSWDCPDRKRGVAGSWAE